MHLIASKKSIDNKTTQYYYSLANTLKRYIMNTVRINVSLSRETYEELSEVVASRGRSRFISEVISNALKERRNRQLAAEYREASREIKRINAELEEAVADGID
jgi:metal-responsive CopG/Arc/MetJ family transcriptional regulator